MMAEDKQTINKTYIVNLERRTDKKAHMIDQFKILAEKDIFLNHCFFDAVDGTSAAVLSKYRFSIPNWHDPNSGKAMTNGEVGCALSHYSIWCDIVGQVDSGQLPESCKILILEDDVVFPNDFGQRFTQYMSEIDRPYDMIYVHRKPLDLESETKLSSHINMAKKSYWTCAYILTYSGAKKLVGSNYLENLIPVDEFLPIMYGCTVFGFEKFYEKCEKLDCLAFTPSIIKLTTNAFADSETFHSDSCMVTNARTNLSLLYIGPIVGDSYNRFADYCKIYGLPLQNIESEQDLIQNLKSIIDPSNCMVIVIYVRSDCYIIPQASPIEIIEKFNQVSTNNDIILADDSNHFLCCGFADKLIYILDQKTEKLLYQRIIKNSIKDPAETIFYQLKSTTDLHISFTKSIATNTNNHKPCFIYTNDYYVRLNQIGNYTGNGWNEYYGYNIPKNVLTDLPKVYLSVNIKSDLSVLGIIQTLDYPRNLLYIKINKLGTDYKTMDDLIVADLEAFKKSNCEYYFYIGPDIVITNGDILRKLLGLGKKMVAPMVVRPETVWTNFWGDLDSNGYYNRSFDYMDIIKYKKCGCWNVPYVNGIYIIHRQVMHMVPDMLTRNVDLDMDMRLCHNLRQNDIYMYVTNLERYGYMLNEDDNPIPITIPEQPIQPSIPNTNNSPVNPTDITIFDITNKSKRVLWEQKYLHPDYLKNMTNLSNIGYTELVSDIYNFPLFSEEFCNELIGLGEKFGHWSAGKNNHHDPRLGKDYYENFPTVDIQLFQLGLEAQWKEIVFSYIAPMAKVLYSNYRTKDINLAFIVKYTVENQASLAPHHDASTYTVNIALNTDYTGGGCRFLRQNYVLKNQSVGMCCIHPGRLTAYHEGLAVTSGKRYILVSFIN